VDDPTSQYQQLYTLTAIIIFAILGGVYGERWRNQLYWAKRRKFKRAPQTKVIPLFRAGTTDFSAQQLSAVTQASFSAWPLLNKPETRLFGILEEEIAKYGIKWRVMAQVSLGEILKSPCKDAFMAINSKRVDFLIITMAGKPRHAIEFQGSGHHQGTAAIRDAVKKEALRKAGIGYHEIMSGDTPADVRRLIARLIKEEPPEPINP
jgi:Protein of unknown function (DUF2726)